MRPALALLLGACSDYEVTKREDAEGVVDCDDAAPTAYTVPQDAGCVFSPEPGSFTPVVEAQWSAAVGQPGHDDVMVTPVVGDVDGDGVPEVVFTAYAANQYGAAGSLVILSGDGLAEEAAWTDVGGFAPLGSAGVALGDLDADGVPEIVTLTADSRVIALHADGSLVWATAPVVDGFTVYGYPTIADLDGDGLAEVAVGRTLWRHDGAPLWQGTLGWGGPYAISVVADLDLDGEQEVIAGNTVYARDGTVRWHAASVADGWPAVGDFDGDGLGEVVSVSGGSAWLLDGDGTVRWGPVPVPGGGGGPPTVADFDGDGAPEVGVAGLSGYVVYDTDGTALWEVPTTDRSSAQTGSSVFDFEGDGRSEVIYADEVTLWVYDGATGAVLLQDDGHSSWTLFEYPLVADVDADGEAELLLASNDSIDPGWQGITVIGDLSGSWAPTAPVWNQHGYHITNVEDDLSIPPVPTMNWLVGHNSFRAGGLREGPGNPAPDLRAALTVCEACPAASASVWVQVENVGTARVRVDVPVALYGYDATGAEVLLDTAWLGGGLDAGAASEPLALALDAASLAGITGLEARVDDDGAGAGVVEECDETDNRRGAVLAGCE